MSAKFYQARQIAYGKNLPVVKDYLYSINVYPDSVQSPIPKPENLVWIDIKGQFYFISTATLARLLKEYPLHLMNNTFKFEGGALRKYAHLLGLETPSTRHWAHFQNTLDQIKARFPEDIAKYRVSEPTVETADEEELVIPVNNRRQGDFGWWPMDKPPTTAGLKCLCRPGEDGERLYFVSYYSAELGWVDPRVASASCYGWCSIPEPDESLFKVRTQLDLELSFEEAKTLYLALKSTTKNSRVLQQITDAFPNLSAVASA